MSNLEIVALAILILIGLMIVSFDNVIVGIVQFLHSNLAQNNIIFQEGIDLSEYDASVILNCLHGGGCPEGVLLTDDDTGEIIQTENVPKKAQPVDPTPELTDEQLYWINFVAETKDPNPLENSISTAIFVYVALIGIGIMIVIFIVLPRFKVIHLK